MRIFITIILILNGLSPVAQKSAIDSLSSMLNAAKDSAKVNVLIALSNEYAYNDPEKAKQYANEATALSKEIGFTKGEIRSLYQLGSIVSMQGDRPASQSFFEAGLEKSRKINDQYLTAKGYYYLSRFYQTGHDMSNALYYLGQALAIFDALKEERDIAYCYSSFGSIYKQLGNYDKSLEYSFRSLRLKEKLHDERGISVTLTNIAHVYLLTSKFDDAVAYSERALQTDKANNDLEGILINTVNIGVASQKKGAWNEALDQYNAALELARQLQYKKDEALILNNIGSTLRGKGEPAKALSYLLSALSIKEKNNYPKSHALNDIAKTYTGLNRFAEAEKHSRLAIEAAQKESDLNQLRYAWLNLADAYKASGDFANAYNALSQSTIFKDSLLSVEKSKQMNNLQVEYESEQKERTIHLLTAQKEEAAFKRKAYLAAVLLITTALLLLYLQQRLISKKNRQMFEKGKEVEKMKSTFFSNISHEFRTPLTLILAPIQALQAQHKDPKTAYQLGTMQKNAERLLSLINQLLDLSKLESGKLNLTVSKADIVPVVKGVVMTFHSLAEINQVELLTNIKPGRLEVYFDTEKIETILINLLSNAFKFTPVNGQVKVELDLPREPGQQKYFQITVTDTGKGIPAKDLDKVFNRYYQSSQPGEASFEGSGIGLTLTKELVNLHKGKIDVASEEGKGTSITVRLPLGEECWSQTELNTVSPGKASVVDAHFFKNPPEPGDFAQTDENGAKKPPVLLLIEDNEDVRYYVKDILREHYQVLEAKDGNSGVAMAMETIPDLIISDVMMPGMTGYQVCEILKQDQKTSHIPLILLTAKASFEDKMEGLQTQADEYLIKPFIPQELLARVENLINSRRQLREKYNRELILKPKEITVNSIDENFLLKLMKAVDENISNEHFSVEDLGQQVGMSRSQIHRKLQALTNQSATQFIRLYRLNRAKDMIMQNAGSISEIAYAVGFGSPSYFSKCFLEQFGITPGQSKAGSNGNG